MKHLVPVLLVAVTSVFASCSGGADQVPPPRADRTLKNVVIVLVDALRMDHLGYNGYERDTSPFIDTLANEGVVFDNARTQSSYTAEAVAALFSGIGPGPNPDGTGWYPEPHPNRPAMPARFSKAGYETACFTNTPALTLPGFLDDFHEAECLVKDFSGPPHTREMTDRGLDFVRRNRGAPHLLYLHYVDPHTPYSPPEAYVARLAGEERPASDEPLNLSQDVQGHYEALQDRGFGPGDPQFDDIVLRYDAEIAFIDDEVSRLMAGLREIGTLDDTLVVFLADHGEEFLEHGYFEHAWTLYDEVLRVPLIFWAPAVLTPERRDEVVSLVDVLPTLHTLTGVAAEPADFTGAPLFAKEEGEWAAAAPDRPVFSHLLIETRQLVHSVVHDGMKYLAAPRHLEPVWCDRFYLVQRLLRNTMRDGAWTPYDYWSPPEHEALYDLVNDPDETKNLVDARPEILEKMRKLLAEERARSQRQPDAEYAAEDPLTEAFIRQLIARKARQKDAPGEPGDAEELPEEATDVLDALGYLGPDD
ncbi:MAG: sulfatase [Candidatus Hydrogenedentota bacterium]